MQDNDFNYNNPASDRKRETNSSDAPKEEEGSYKRLLGDKPITWMWLMQHYSKANAAAYKRQKAERKEGKKKGNGGSSSEGSERERENRRRDIRYDDERDRYDDRTERRYDDRRQDRYDDGRSRDYNDRTERRYDDLRQDRYDDDRRSRDYDDRTGRRYDDWDWSDQHSQEKDIKSGNGSNFGDTIVLNQNGWGEGGSESGSGNVPVLECVGYGQNVELDRFPCRIGRDPEQVDICIPDNMAVGHFHAVLLKEGDYYYIQDHNSKNHVFVNGNMLEPNGKSRISDGTRIRLANEDFVFHVNR